jgi:hypothetical protein
MPSYFIHSYRAPSSTKGSAHTSEPISVLIVARGRHVLFEKNCFGRA